MDPVGFDVGESKLLVGCALRDNTPVDSLFVDGGRVRHLRERQASTEDRLKPRYASNLCDDLVWGRWQDVIKDEKEKASHRAVEYASQFENPVNVLNNLTVSPTGILGSTGIDDSAGGCSFDCSHASRRRRRNTESLWNTRTCTCIRAIRRRCVMRVNIGYRPYQGTFKCTNDTCGVSEYQADLNAAANRANRLNP